ncbi:hypothetical protein [Microbacterium sp.]|jgi:hypothetical protein|uniref:hypothetical protein n=1 Tax=Microbacterium sp. TaxID=51671 RepID=UPI0037C9820E
MVFEPTFEEFDADAAARDAALSNSVDPETVVHATHAIDLEAPADTETAVADEDLDDDLDAGLEGEADAALSDEAGADDLPPYGEE